MTRVFTLPEFEKSLVRLCKKYPSLKTEYIDFVELTETDGVQGTSLGKGIFKARLAVKAKGKGKSGGLRIISFSDILLSFDGETVILVEIYDKSEFSTVSRKIIDEKVKEFVSRL
jgi:hypothetical protein